MAHDEQVAEELLEAAARYRRVLNRLRKASRRVDREIRAVMADRNSDYEERRARAEEIRARGADEIERLIRRLEVRRERGLEAVGRLHSTRTTDGEAREAALALLQRGHNVASLIAQARALGDYETLEALVKLIRYSGDPTREGRSQFIAVDHVDEAVARIEGMMLAVSPEDETDALEAAQWVRSVADEADITVNYAAGVARGSGGPGERMMLGLARGEARPVEVS